MGLSCGMSMVKYLLFIFNLICALCGIAILAIGIVYYIQIDELQKLFQDNNVIAAPITFIVIGSIVFIISFFGCCGAIRESHCMTFTYSIFLLILIIAQIVIGVIVFVYIGDVQTALRGVLDKFWETRDQNMDFWNIIQQRLECCGNTATLNWIGNTPPSCCSDNSPSCGILSITQGTLFITPCRYAMETFIENSGNILGAVVLGLAAVQFIGFVFACCLANSIRNETRSTTVTNSSKGVITYSFGDN